MPVLDLTAPELSIVIVNWNSTRFLRACLPSIASETNGLAYEVIVVDNGSTEDMAAFAAEFAFIRLIRSEGNIGFARANNVGFRHARAPYVLFLNPDTRIVGQALPAMLDVLKRRPDAGVVGCRLLNSDLTLQTSCVQRYPRVMNQALSTDFLYLRFPRLPLWGLAPLFDETREPVPVEVVSGACIMVRRDVFERVGLFSEEYFMYAEDADLCHKVAQAGWRCYHLGDVTVVHHGGGSSRLHTTNNWAAVVQCGAKLQFIRKTRGEVYGNLYRMAMAVSAAIRVMMLACASVFRTGRERGDYIRGLTAKWTAVFLWALRPMTAHDWVIRSRS